MLPDHLTQLLTLYVDGEASPSQQQAAQGLLERSAAARTLFAQLQEDAQRLRGLPRRRLETDLSAKVLRAIAERQPRHPRRLASLGLRPYPAWMGAAIAAGVLLVIGFGSYLYVEIARRLPAEQARQQEGTAPGQPGKQPATPVIADVKQPEPAPEKGAPPDDLMPAPPRFAQAEDATPAPKSPTPRPQTPRPPARNEYATPDQRTEGLENVSPGVALNLALWDLDQGPWKERLRKELRRETSFRIELFCLGNGKARDRLGAAFKAAGVHLLIEPEAQARLKSHRVKADYALYTDALTADELAKVLEHLGRADKQAEAKRHGDGQFDRLFLWPVSAADRKELNALFGVDTSSAPPAKPRAPLGVDVRKPVAEDTAAQVVQSLERPVAPRRETGKTVAPKAPERLALLVPYLPGRPRPPASKEVKQFLDSRKDRPQGTVQLFLVLREMNG